MEIIRDSPSAHVELESRPDSVALVRAMLSGAVERMRFEPALIDHLQMAVSEACNNVVMHAYPGTSGPMIVHLEACADGIEVSIQDHGRGFSQVASAASGLGTGVALISTLVDRAEFFTPPGGGTEVRLTLTRHKAGDKPLLRPVTEGCPERLRCESPDEVAVTLSPTTLLAGVLGRMTRLLAAKASFSLPRFSDVFLLVDRLVAHAERYATSPGISFGLCAHESQLDMRIGPLQARGPEPAPAAPSPVHGYPELDRLVDELSVKPVDHSQMLCLVVRDSGGLN